MESAMSDNKYFHYTSINTLYNIISNQELWFSNLRNSNDPNEVCLTCEQYNEYIDNLGINPYHGTPLILSKNKVMGSPYGLSLTTLEDSLTQWERYGDNLKGIAIVFDVDYIQKFLYENYHFRFYFDKMKYTEEDKKALIMKNVNSMPVFENYNWQHDWPFFALFFLIHFSEARALFKSKDFIDEKEYRLFFDPIEYKFYHETICLFDFGCAEKNVKESKEEYRYAKDVVHFLEQDKKYALMRNGINSYLKLDLNLFGKDKDKIIKEIKLGPKCMQDEDELLNFLSAHGYKPIITKSKINIR